MTLLVSNSFPICQPFLQFLFRPLYIAQSSAKDAFTATHIVQGIPTTILGEELCSTYFTSFGRYASVFLIFGLQWSRGQGLKAVPFSWKSAT